jgi:hypothetical protein
LLRNKLIHGLALLASLAGSVDLPRLANLLLLRDDIDRHDDDEIDGDRLRPTGGSALSDRQPEPPPPPFLSFFLRNTGSGKAFIRRRCLLIVVIQASDEVRYNIRPRRDV